MNKTIAIVSFITFLSFNISAQKAVSEKPNYRPKFHYTSPKNWVNDPNGLVYLDGEYHLFYQYNLFGNEWGHMSWGHAVSRDLQNWKTLPVALPEFDNNNGTTTMIFSGCAVVDSLNTSGFFKQGFKKGLVAIFTSHIDKNGKGIAQHQSLAYSSDKGRTWKFYDKNPVLDLKMTDFRDPNVIWYKDKWVMTVVKPLEYTVQFYESKDLKNWSLMSEFGNKGDVSHIWECPSLVKVPVENSKESKWLLMISGGNRQQDFVGMQYFVGDFDGKNFVSQNQTERRPNEVFYIDEGKDFYAAVPFYNLPKSQKNPIIIGWINNWIYARETPTSGFRGGFSVPRKLSLFMENNVYKLKQEPILNSIVPTEKITLKSNQKISSSIGNLNSNSYRKTFIINLLNTKGFDLSLLKTDVNSCVICYDVATETLSFDRTNSGNVAFNKNFPSIEKMQIKPENNQLKLDILVDNSVVEIYANGGKLVITDLVFPASNQGKIQINWKKQ